MSIVAPVLYHVVVKETESTSCNKLWKDERMLKKLNRKIYTQARFLCNWSDNYDHIDLYWKDLGTAYYSGKNEWCSLIDISLPKKATMFKLEEGHFAPHK